MLYALSDIAELTVLALSDIIFFDIPVFFKVRRNILSIRRGYSNV